MQAPYNDRWERTKRYLLRNFLVNPGFRLSPIAEEERSSSSSSSSLPELVVEPEPDRHDHSPGFYEGLERRMRRYYRQLFLGAGSDDEDSIDFEVNRSMASTFMLDTHAREDIERAKHIAGDKTDSEHLADERPTDPNDECSDDNKADDESNEIEHDEDDDQDGVETNEMEHDEECVEADYYKDDTEKNEIEHDEDDDQDGAETNEIDHDEECIKENYDNADAEKNKIEHDKECVDDVENCKLIEHISTYCNNEAEVSETSKSKSDSDLTPCHRISTTVVEIHEDKPVRAARSLEDGSPVLLPRLKRFSKSSFGCGERNASPVVRDFKIPDAIIQRGSPLDATILNEHDDIEETEVQNLLRSSEVTSASQDSAKTHTGKLSNDFEIDDHDKEQELDKIPMYTIRDKTQRYEYSKPETDALRTDISSASPHSDNTLDTGMLSNDIETDNTNEEADTTEDKQQLRYNRPQTIEESIGPDEFNFSPNKITNISIHNQSIDDSEPGSFETLIRRGVFESKNVRITIAQRTDDEVESTDEDLESVEEMRAATEAHIDATFMRKSTDSHDMLAFEANASAEKLEEISSDADEINVSPDEPEKATNGHSPSGRTSCRNTPSQHSQSAHTSSAHTPSAHTISEHTPSEHTPSAQTSSEHSRSAHTLSAHTLSGHTPSAHTSSEHTPSAQTSSEHTPSAHTTSEHTPSGHTLSAHTLSGHTPSAHTSSAHTPSVHTSSEHTPSAHTPSAHTSSEHTPSPHTSSEHIPSAHISPGHAPSVHTPSAHTPSNTNVFNAIDAFWSVSPIQIDAEKLAKHSPLQGTKRKDSDAESSAKRARRDVAVQTSLDKCLQWEGMRPEFFVGTPLVLRLCGCVDHVCP